ncbi:hypothetical protein N7451_012610 [Penicillium sp. IBT 35674x]|nr:hypothetical protein N7451_012610 [Penicillium sp. IBT 35674x]
MAPRTRHGQRGEGQEQQRGQRQQGGQALPKQFQEAQPTTAPLEPNLSPTPPPPPKPPKYPEVEQLIRDQIEFLKGRPNYEYHVNHYAREIKTSLISDIIEEAARRADMDLNETSKVIAERIDPKDVMLDVTQPLQMQGYYGCDELPPINWTDFESTEIGPRTF